MGQQEIDGVLAQVPRRRTIATRLAPGEPGDGIVGTDEIGLFFLPALLRGGNMRPAVMRHLVPVLHHRLTGAGVALDGKSRDEPSGADTGGFEQGQDAPRADEAELPARERRRGRHATGDEARLGIEVEGQAHDVAGHLCLPERGHGCNRHSIVSPPPPLACSIQPDCMMATQTIGIIVNGATGRIGSTQHLANSLVPIINEGGLPLGNDRLVPRLLLVGRDRERLAEVARAHGIPEWTTDLNAALADPAWTIFFDAAATQQRVAVLAKALAAGKHVYSEKPVAPTAALGLTLLSEAEARGRKHGAVEDKVHLPGLQKLAALM